MVLCSVPNKSILIIGKPNFKENKILKTATISKAEASSFLVGTKIGDNRGSSIEALLTMN